MATSLDTQIDNLKTLQESFDAISDIKPMLQEIVDAKIINGIKFDEFTFDSYEPLSIIDLLTNSSSVIGINSDRAISLIDQCLSLFTNVRTVTMPNVKTMASSSLNTVTKSGYLLKEFYFENADTMSGIEFLRNSGAYMKVLSLPKIPVSAFSGYGSLSACSNLIDLIIGKSATTSFALKYWSPTNALSDTAVSLLTTEDIDAGYTSNLEKLLYNIREHIAGNLPDRTGLDALTITFTTAVKSAISADEDTLKAFTDKNWTIA